MQIETLLSEQKWVLLQCLAKTPQSPMQLAQALNTTIANISQQLKLLEAINLVKKEKIRNREKGQPRTIFSIAQDRLLLIGAWAGFSQRKLLVPKAHQTAILSVWMHSPPHLHRELEMLCALAQSNQAALVFDASTSSATVFSDKKIDILRGDLKVHLLQKSQFENHSKKQNALVLLRGI